MLRSVLVSGVFALGSMNSAPSHAKTQVIGSPAASLVVTHNPGEDLIFCRNAGRLGVFVRFTTATEAIGLVAWGARCDSLADTVLYALDTLHHVLLEPLGILQMYRYRIVGIADADTAYHPGNGTCNSFIAPTDTDVEVDAGNAQSVTDGSLCDLDGGVNGRADVVLDGYVGPDLIGYEWWDEDSTVLASSSCSPEPCGSIRDTVSLSIGTHHATLRGTVISRVPPAVDVFVMDTVTITIRAACCVNRGDADHGDGELPVNVADVTYLVEYLFRSGPHPLCREEADVFGADCSVDVADLTFLVAYLFQGGPPPPPCS